MPFAAVPKQILDRFSSWLSSLRLFQQTFKSIRFQLLKRLHNHIGVKILALVTYTYAPHTGAARPSIPALASSTTIHLSAGTPTRKRLTRKPQDPVCRGAHLQPIRCPEKRGLLKGPPAPRQCWRAGLPRRLLGTIHFCGACPTKL